MKHDITLHEEYTIAQDIVTLYQYSSLPQDTKATISLENVTQALLSMPAEAYTRLREAHETPTISLEQFRNIYESIKKKLPQK